MKKLLLSVFVLVGYAGGVYAADGPEQELSLDEAKKQTRQSIDDLRMKIQNIDYKADAVGLTQKLRYYLVYSLPIALHNEVCRATNRDQVLLVRKKLDLIVTAREQLASAIGEFDKSLKSILKARTETEFEKASL